MVDTLIDFNLDYNLNTSSKLQLNEMALSIDFIKSYYHCRITEYILKYRICGKHDCDICAKISRYVRTLNINVNGINIRNEVLLWMDLPIIDPINKNIFFTIKLEYIYWQ